MCEVTAREAHGIGEEVWRNYGTRQRDGGSMYDQNMNNKNVELVGVLLGMILASGSSAMMGLLCKYLPTEYRCALVHWCLITSKRTL